MMEVKKRCETFLLTKPGSMQLMITAQTYDLNRVLDKSVHSTGHAAFFCSVLLQSAGSGVVGSAEVSRPRLCRAAPPTAVGSAHNSPLANATVILKSGLVHYRLHNYITRVGSFTSSSINTRTGRPNCAIYHKVDLHHV